jgi:uncharacterized protein YcbK (DUF882 family)
MYEYLHILIFFSFYLPFLSSAYEVPLMQDIFKTDCSRRSMLKAGAALASALIFPPLAHASVNPAFKNPTRSIALVNPHTGDTLKTVYWEKGIYHPEPLKDIAYMMRDIHSQDMSPIDPRLVDILYMLQNSLRTKSPFEVVCGYRTPRNNAYIYKHERGVARNSYHMYGRAVDIRMKDRSAGVIQRAAWALQQGGVGYYPKAGFVHIDTGGVRRW